MGVETNSKTFAYLVGAMELFIGLPEMLRCDKLDDVLFPPP